MDRLLILYGSQTGTAEEVAERIAREGRKCNYSVQVFAMDEYPKAELVNEKLVIFVCSTTGQGEEPDNMKASRNEFNFPAKKLNKRLAQLGAHCILPRGDGDDQHRLGLFLTPEEIKQNASETRAAEISHPAKVLRNLRMTSDDHFQDVRHLEFEIPPGVRYEAGDVMVIPPRNLPHEVQEVIDFFSWQSIADQPFKLVPTRDDVRIPSRWPKVQTLRELLEKRLDVFGRPRRYFFELLSYFTADENHEEKLREFASAEGQDELYTYCHRPKRTIFEVLQDFHTAKFPMEYLLDLVQPMRPRSFSIASSLMAHPERIHLTVAVVSYKSSLKKIRKGICSNWLSTLKPGDEVEFSITKGTMRSLSPDSPLIMIAPGTGVAPMRSFLQDRVARGIQKNVLFFGCRNATKDFLYCDEMQSYAQSGQLALHTAFSRDQDDKIYVQHRILENSTTVWDLIENQKATIMLSGNAKRMPIDVADVLVEVFQTAGNMDKAQAERYLADLEKKNRFQQDFPGCCTKSNVAQATPTFFVSAIHHKMLRAILQNRAGLKPVLSTLPRQVVASPAVSLIARSQYATDAKKRPEPKEVATSLINMFPGDSLVAKSGSVLVASSIAAFLISKEIYIVDAEFFEMFCIFGAYYLWYRGGKDGMIEYFNDRKSTVQKVLTQAREDHKAVVKERMEHIGKMSDIVDVTNNLYEMSKEIAQMEAEAYELKQRVAFTSEVKSVLDGWVRHEASIREREQKRLVTAVIEKVSASLQDAKTQQAILTQTLVDVDKLLKAKAV
ncbi:NADPH-dependent diflavin oxidoreductase 1 [Quaeritorhiza haematococci]|nr:NADPH-dependent diflavin oxidoreductase 1 [Quaeritorhiza haematococci]